MFLFLFIFSSLLFSNGFGCLSTPGNDATPEIPVVPCQSCTLTKLDAPETGTSITTDGTITEEIVDGCKSFTIQCVATRANPDTRSVCMGANLDTITLAFGNGPQMATAVCNADGEVEGRTTAGDTVILESVYCCQAK